MGDGQNIQIFVRCRPLTENERVGSLSIDPDEQAVKIESQNREFIFDQVFAAETPQEDVFKAVVMPLLPQVLQGYDCAVLAYGQTGTGKTYTMEGERSLDINNTEGIGIIPRAVSQIFELLHQRGNEFSVHVSFLELYSEEVYDLLSSPDEITKLRIFDDKNKQRSVKVEGLQEVAVQSESDIFDILAMGSSKRQTTATLLNACSSRSHSIFTITVSEKLHDCEVTRIGKLNLVDLAGSENIARSGAQNKHAREAGNINQSLLTLTRVITALVEKRPHIPYRESKLTRILQDSLGGATRTSMIATISLAEIDLGNTIGTLDYASRARKITNRPESNRQLTRRTASDLEDYRHQIEDLIRCEVAKDFRREVEKLRAGFNAEMEAKIGLMKQTITDLQSDLVAEKGLVTEFRNKNQELEKQIDDQQSDLVAEKGLFTEFGNKIQELEKQIADQQSELVAEKGLVTEFRNKNQELEKQIADQQSDLVAEKGLFTEFGNKIQELEKQIADQQSELVAEKGLVTEFRNKNQELEKQITILNYMVNDQKQLIEDIRRNFKKREDELMERLDKTAQPVVSEESDHASVWENDVAKKLPKRKRAPTQHDDYVNMTFTGDDEIVQVSAKKTRSKINVGPKQRQELTLSGRKKKLTNYGDDIDLSPISPPVRITRSRNTRRKLAY